MYFVAPAGSAFSRSLLGTAVYNHDAVLNAGILEWGFRSISTSGLSFFDWPPGFPLKNGLAATENLAGWQLFYAPVRSLGATVAASYNVALLASFLVAGLSTAAFSRRLGASRAGALIAGFAFAFNPFHLDHAIHIQTMAICWSPLALLGLDLALEGRSYSGLAMLGSGFVMTFLCGMYFGVFLSMVIALYVLAALLARRYEPNVGALARIAATIAVALAVLSPIFIHYVRYASSFGAYPHTTTELSLSSLPLEALIRTPTWLWAWNRTVLTTAVPGQFVGAFPGFVTLALAGFGLASRKATHASRSAVSVLLIVAVICFLLALGPDVEIHSRVPSPWLTALPLPGKLWIAFSAVRWPMRIFMYSVLCIALVAGLGATKLLDRLSSKQYPIVASIIVVLMFVELRPASWFASSSVRIVDPIRMSSAYAFLARERDRGGIVELPSRMDSGIATPFATRYAYGSAGHLRGVIAFHGSLFPSLLDSLRLASYDLPNPDAVRMMVSHGVSRVVLHSDLMSADSFDRLMRAFLSNGDSILFQSSGSVVMTLSHR